MNYTDIIKHLSNKRVHFVGIKGTGMTALAEIFYNSGAIITGSDVADSFYTDAVLKELGIPFTLFSASNITKEISFIVYSAAYKLEENPELIKATSLKIPCLLYTEALGAYSSLYYSIGICGVHGKTTTTGLCGTLLKCTTLPYQVLAGSVINSFKTPSLPKKCTYTSSTFLAKSNKPSDTPADLSNTPSYFIAETCEYQRHFLSFFPKIIILTSIEHDHQDYYPTFSSILNAFVEYILRLEKEGVLIYCADDEGVKKLVSIVKTKRSDIEYIPYGKEATGDFSLNYLVNEKEENSFTLSLFGSSKFSLALPGKHLALDAAAALTLCATLLRKSNLSPLSYTSALQKELLTYSGGARRSERLGEVKLASGVSILFIDDYGHHPTAIKKTLSGYRTFYKNRLLIVDFMSHTYSRTASLLKEFASSFSAANILILHKIYSSARENPKDFSITGRTLYEEVLKFNKENDTAEVDNKVKEGKKAQEVYYFDEVLDALPFIKDKIINLDCKEYKDGILFVTMGAGDNWKLSVKLLEAF